MEYLPLVRNLFQLEAEYRTVDTNDGEYFENLYWNALFLYQIGDLTDVIPMWRAKRINMDTGFGLDVQFLVGNVVSETLEYLRQHHDHRSTHAADYIRDCQDCGDFNHMDEWLADRIEYFR